jgi:hypothetical protein
VDFALVHPHQGSTTISTDVLRRGFRSLQHWRRIGHCSSGQGCGDDLERLSEAFSNLEPRQHPPKFKYSNPPLFLSQIRSVALNRVRAVSDTSVRRELLCRWFPMDLARLYELHADECARSAEKIDNPGHRAMLLKAAAEWRKAAQELRRLQHPSPSQEQRPSEKLQAQHPASHSKKPGRGG